MEDLSKLPKTKKDAILIKSVSYYTGLLCKNGHLDKRYTNTGICYSCKNQNSNKDYKNHTKRISDTNKKSYIKNKKKRLLKSKKWAQENKIKSRQIKINYKKRNLSKVREEARKYQQNKRLNPLYRLNKNISKAIWVWLKGLKSFRHWEEIVKFSFEELKNSLESKFRDGMTWENYGRYWHVDHIKPLSLCYSIEEAWNISNLQPLLASENLSKGNRYIG